jgi:hypothetical protein
LEEHFHHCFWLQEDGDSSHENKSTNNLYYRIKRAADLRIFLHPTQSPDLNPIEACWQIMKQRLRGRTWKTVAEFKAAIQAAWDLITIEEIRKRISEMPKRCKNVQRLGGRRIRSDLW